MPRQNTISAQTAPVTTGFLNKTAAVDGVRYPYVVYVPQNYSPRKQWPVILFLHGSGERGSDGLIQTQVGLGAAIRMHPARYPALAVLPQCARDSNGWDGKMLDFALLALDQTLAEYTIDPARQYLTGLSMGGFGSWRIASLHPERFAAVVPICGGGEPKTMAKKLKGLPIWVFHGESDEVVLPARSQKMVEAIRAAGSEAIRYTLLPGIGHNSWDPAYNSKEFTDWLFSQRLR
jgi:predicted peptidase